MDAIHGSMMPPELTQPVDGRIKLAPLQIVQLQQQFRLFYKNFQPVFRADEKGRLTLEVADEGRNSPDAKEFCRSWQEVLRNKETLLLVCDAVPDLRRATDASHFKPKPPTKPTSCVEVNQDHMERTDMYLRRVFPLQFHDQAERYIRSILGAESASDQEEITSGDASLHGTKPESQMSWTQDDDALADRAFTRLSAMYQMLENARGGDDPELRHFTKSYRSLRSTK